jgi:hypothetical protein
VLAPAASVGIARVIVEIAENWGVRWAVPIGSAFLVIAVAGSASTWRTPAEWQGIRPASEAVRGVVPPDRLLIAPEALLFEADRRGCRLEVSPSGARRAAGEWGGRLDDPHDPIALVEFYRGRGAAYLADLGPEADPASDPRRAGLREAARSLGRVLLDRPDVFAVELAPHPLDEGTPHADRD